MRALLIDLDDTLYDERSYVLSGFRAVSAHVERRHGVQAEAFLHDLIEGLEREGRGKLFDVALARAALPADPQTVGELVQVYREHRPTISLWPGVADRLAELRRDRRIAVVTDGLHLMQQRKVEALGVADLVDTVVFCWEIEAPKPDPTGFREALRRLDAQPERSIVIGDNPRHDMAAAAAIGARSIRVRTGRFAALDDPAFAADDEAASSNDVGPAVRRLEMEECR